MERISLFVKEDLNTVKIEVVNKEDNQEEGRCEIILKAESPSTGEASEKISCFKKGEDITITFNADYILDVLKIIKTENTIIKMNDPLNPVIITPEEDKDYTYILMPVRAE
jgi:DNA polymerase-3 subunit beta